ncbi:MAG: cytochrome P450 [Paracoccaceae bacterium]
MTPPKPVARKDNVSLWRYVRLFGRDILSAQPARLYRARMAEFRTPFFRSYLINQPDLIRTVLNERPLDFPKSARISEGLRPLLGHSVFLSNGELWLSQRRIIDPAFEGGRLRDTFPAMLGAAQAAVERLKDAPQVIEMEEFTSRATADVIFRTLFSIPISHDIAAQVFSEFRAFQRSQPILNLAAFLPLPRWLPRFRKARTRRSAAKIRGLIRQLTEARLAEIKDGTAPDDLASKIMTQADPTSGRRFDQAEMVDQVAIFFLAGHETSAAALGWALYLLALSPEHQDRVAAEAAGLPESPALSDISALKFTKNVFRETLRLYPPVPMMVRQTTGAERFRDRDLSAGAQVVISPWHLHRHERYWSHPDEFDPDRFGEPEGKISQREAFIPFSSGARVCPGAGFAMIEGPLLLALLVAQFKFERILGRDPVPQAHLTVRARDGIWLNVSART